jgi:acyl-CoA thioester hydrolase
MNTSNHKPIHISHIRVRYGETDRMGVLHHSVYPLYLEEARTDLMRRSEITYKELEDSGIIFPVRNINITFFYPAFYDEVIDIKVTLEEIRGPRIIFSYELTNQEGKQVATATTELAFTSGKTFRPIRPPQKIVKMLMNIK